MAISLVLSGCSEIQYDSGAITTSETAAVSEETTSDTSAAPDEDELSEINSLPDKYSAQQVNINAQEYSETIQLEDIENAHTHTGLTGYSGEGYVQLSPYEYLTVEIYAPSAQYYSVSVKMCAFSAGVDVIVGGEDIVLSPDDYETINGNSKGIIYIDDVTAFTDFTVNGIYLKKGENYITLQGVSGTAYIDCVTVKNGASVPDSYYSMSALPVNSDANAQTVRIMNYFSEIYGEKTLSGQTVTNGTNAEIAAIFKLTGRLPVIRCGELAYAQADSPLYDEALTDLDLAAEWSENGGLVSYDWTWYSPCDDSHYLAQMTSFDFTKAVSDTDVSAASFETIEKIYGDGGISTECFRLIQSMDEMAEKLKILRDKNVTVLFHPLYDPDGEIYWWSESAEAYKWLWQTMVKRFSEYHGLNNIIWVWSGSEEFYPGSDYVDIIGEDVYNFTQDSGNLRILSAAYAAADKSVSMTRCVRIPDPDILDRDNAKWLWFTLMGGDYIIDENAVLTGKYSSNDEIDKAYNHESVITLDEFKY